MDLEMREVNRRPEGLMETAIEVRDNVIGDPNALNKDDCEGERPSSSSSSSCVVININGGDGGGDLGENQKVCRICHLSAKESGKTSVELMEIGCGCKGELGVAHSHCAEAWFRVKGNRLCEICGVTAKNITGVGDNGFMEEWNESRSAEAYLSSSDESRRCLRGQPLCNFLMACLVIAFVLPWFFRVNMF